jgi:hypothetical protein
MSLYIGKLYAVAKVSVIFSLYIPKGMLKMLTVTVFISAEVKIISVCVPLLRCNSDLQDVVMSKLSMSC